ncbi:unnamed protein product [Urochloa humidicola]
MDVIMDDATGDIEFSGCNSTRPPPPRRRCRRWKTAWGCTYAWNALSPVGGSLTWAGSAPTRAAAPHGLIESMLCDDALVSAAAHLYLPMFPDDAYCSSNGSAPSSTTTI